jgi:hypothetical protein
MTEGMRFATGGVLAREDQALLDELHAYALSSQGLDQST